MVCGIMSTQAPCKLISPVPSPHTYAHTLTQALVTITSSSVVVAAGWLLLLLPRALRVIPTMLGLLLVVVVWGCGGKGRRRPTTAAAAPIDAYPRLPNGRSGCSDADAVGRAPVQL